MQTVLDRMRADLNDARRARDRLRTAVLSMTLAEAKNRQIELGRELTDEDMIDVVGRAIRRRREAASQIRDVGRTEHAEREEQEAGILMPYLPAQLPEDDVRQLARAAIADGAADIGAVMAIVMPQVRGRFDGREANRIVREELG